MNNCYNFYWRQHHSVFQKIRINFNLGFSNYLLLIEKKSKWVRMLLHLWGLHAYSCKTWFSYLLQWYILGINVRHNVNVCWCKSREERIWLHKVHLWSRGGKDRRSIKLEVVQKLELKSCREALEVTGLVSLPTLSSVVHFWEQIFGQENVQIGHLQTEREDNHLHKPSLRF